jgi:glucose/arabinose dehydrogenase
MRSLVKILSCVWVAAAAPPALTANLPAGFTEKVVASTLNQPTAMAFAPDGRLFVCQQGGSLRVVKAGALLAKPFLTLNVDGNGERGLLGVAFDPSFASNNYVYVYYTAKTPAVHNRVSRFTASGDTALTGSEVVLLDLDNLTGATNHNGGAIHFGPDGKLYIAAGENASSSNSQTLTNLLGKILRMSPDGGIPIDNPFYGTATGKNRLIWALGLRNPFTFAFQRTTGALFINDVGASSWEEINKGVAGANYGWPATEGFTTNSLYRGPVFTYPHGSGSTSGNCIAGGTFFEPSATTYPASFSGLYFFADYVNGWIRTVRPADSAVAGFATGISSPVDLLTGPDGNLYYLARGAGAVYVVQFVPTGVVDAAADLPGTIGLEQNYPNPFNGSSEIRFRVPLVPSAQAGGASGIQGATGVTLQVFDLLGRNVATLVDGPKAPGDYTVRFDAGGLSSGTYVVRLQAGGQARARTIVLIR